MFVLFVCFWLHPAISAAQQVLDRSYWERSAKEDLAASLQMTLNMNVAKNVIIFVGDGMGPNTVTAARIYRAGESSYLFWEKFPHVGAVKTYNNNKQVPDSASTATAMFTGVKTNQNMLGLDATVNEFDCDSSLREEFRLKSIGRLAQEAGKSTGIVTTTRITHATPAAMYAKSAHRDWECDNSIPASASKCKDIGRQLIEDLPGKDFNVIMGGGRQILKTNSTDLPEDPIVMKKSCVRTDGSNLIKEWADDKAARGLRYAVAENTKGLRDVDVEKTDYLLGIFANDHMAYEYKRDTSDAGMPSLKEMTITALNILKKNDNGFLLMVEGGLIDKAHHIGKARVSLVEVLGFNDAINATMKLLQENGIEGETLVVVTSDHSHTLTISGYPTRGNSILGLADVSKVDGMPYTTLGYANSGKENYHYAVLNGSVVREDPSKVDTKSFEYGAQAAVLQDENKHGGNDVFVYAKGPFAHLFHNMHEQNYITAVIKYAARLGEFQDIDKEPSSSSFLQPSSATVIMSLTIVISLLNLNKFNIS
ncbi:alkaline phosphatase [Halyomorpha halys]|uniref:alkaline phosphatase n=1 Tax=Halyomorpha halys TaxID=286706 RepID=UPI0006D51D53|nr:alkaline phosphatase-like [Halyomorpha halys]